MAKYINWLFSPTPPVREHLVMVPATLYYKPHFKQIPVLFEGSSAAVYTPDRFQPE